MFSPLSFIASVPLLFLVVSVLVATEVSSSEGAPPEAYNTQPESIPLLAGQTVLDTVTAPEGFRVQLFASDPDVRQPIGFTTDHKGRLWVAENYTYAEGGVGFAKDQKDRIIILEDTDSDGIQDKRKVFWDQGDKLTSVLVGFGGVFALVAPRLVFIPDSNGDDIPDASPATLLDGWDDGPVGHNIVNGLAWGPDGWIYGRHGIQATSLVGPPGASPSQRTALNCCVWRYHPTKKLFEVVTQGTTNPWGFDYDDHGQMFLINTVIGHLWHVVPGAWFKRMYGAHFEPHLYQLIDQCADHIHWDSGELWNAVQQGMTDTTAAAGGGHAHCGLMVYLGNNWPDRYRNSVFTVNLHGHRLNNDTLERSGAGYTGKHSQDLLFINDPWFRGIEMIYGPDGGVYLADWTDIGECHETDGVHRTSGRIFKITYGETERTNPLDLSLLSDAELVEMQLHPNDWFVRQSRRLLQERAAEAKDLSAVRKELFSRFATHPDVTRRLRFLWCLTVTGDLEEEWLRGLLADPNEHVRVWAIRLLVDQNQFSEQTLGVFASLAETDTSGLVRQFLASAMQKMDTSWRWPIATALASRDEDAGDRVQPLMVWYGILDAVPRQPDQAIGLMLKTTMPFVRESIARRLASDLETHPDPVEQLSQALIETTSSSIRLGILNGMSLAFAGWAKATPPPSWSKVVDLLSGNEDGKTRELVSTISLTFGEGRAVDELKAVATDGAADPVSRRKAIEALASARPEGIEEMLIKLVDDRSVAAQAAKGLALYSHPDTPAKLLGRYRSLDPAFRTECLNTLCSKPAFAGALLDVVAAGEISREDLSAFHARQIRSFGDDHLSKRLTELWGEVRETDEQKKDFLASFQSKLTRESIAVGNPRLGKEQFTKACAACHVLFGEGRIVGPDLTGGNRKNLAYLLENMIDPSATVPTDFRMSIVTLYDGRILNGVVIAKNERTLTLRTQDEEMVLDQVEIEEVTDSSLSLMPDGLLDTLSEAEVRDLFSYLQSDAPVR